MDAMNVVKLHPEGMPHGTSVISYSQHISTCKYWLWKILFADIRTHETENSHRRETQCMQWLWENIHYKDNSHRRTHMEEKPDRCNECRKAFSHMPCLVKHKRTHAREKQWRWHILPQSHSLLDSSEWILAGENPVNTMTLQMPSETPQTSLHVCGFLADRRWTKWKGKKITTLKDNPLTPG